LILIEWFDELHAAMLAAPDDSGMNHDAA